VTSGGLQVSILEIVEPGSRRDVPVDVEVDWGLESATVGPRLTGDLVLENAAGTLVVRGIASTTLGLACHRCLTEWTEDLEVRVTEAFGVDGDDDGYPLEGEIADLEPVLRDAVLLAVPLRPLCREGCLGLCAACGADLNTGACPGHDDEQEEATPFAVLRDLLEP